MRSSVYNKYEFDDCVNSPNVSRTFEYDENRTDQGFYQPIDKTVQGFIATGRNILSLRQPVEDYDYQDGDNIDSHVPGEGTSVKSLYKPDIADVSQEMHDNDALIGNSVKKVNEEADLRRIRESERQSDSKQSDSTNH